MIQLHHSVPRLCLFLALGFIAGCTESTPAARETRSTPNGLASEVSIFGASVSPSILEDSDTASVELGVKFRSRVPGTITGIRFYKGSSANAAPRRSPTRQRPGGRRCASLLP